MFIILMTGEFIPFVIETVICRMSQCYPSFLNTFFIPLSHPLIFIFHMVLNFRNFADIRLEPGDVEQ